MTIENAHKALQAKKVLCYAYPRFPMTVKAKRKTTL